MAPAESLSSLFNIIKGSLVAPESSWPYASSHTFRMLQNPESFENDPNHLGIIVESLLNHSFQETRKGRDWISVDSKSRLRRELEHDAERHASAGQEAWWAS